MNRLRVFAGGRGSEILVVVLLSALPAGEAWGWTPQARTVLHDLARSRLDALSYYGVGWLLAVAGFRTLWNAIRRKRPGTEPLSYRWALGWSVVWSAVAAGAFTVVVGAAELVWPGSSLGEPIAAGFALEKSESTPATVRKARQQTEVERETRFAELREGLWREADRLGGVFPARREEAELPPEMWKQAGFPSVDLIYRHGLRRAGLLHDGPAEPLVIEYDLRSDGTRQALFTDGTVGPFPAETRPEAKADWPQADKAPLGAGGIR